MKLTRLSNETFMRKYLIRSEGLNKVILLVPIRLVVKSHG